MIAMVAAALAAATVFADFTYYVRQNGGNDSNKYTSNDKEWNLHLSNNAVQSNCYTTVATAADYKDPKFRDRASGDYRLKRTSPLRNAGQRLDWMTEGALDLAGQGRVNGENPDIGCYEYWWYSTGMMLFFK